MTWDQLQEILVLAGAAPADEHGFRELPQKTTLTFYVAKESVGLTVADVEALAVRGHQLQARTIKGDLYILSIEDIFACNVAGRAHARSARRAGFAAE